MLLDFLIGGLVVGGIYALIAVGLNLQYGVARVLNLAYGELLMLGGYAAFFGFTWIGFPPLVTALVGVPVAFGLSWVLFRYVLHPLLARTPDPGKREVDSILSTFGLLFLLQGIALVAWTGNDREYSYLVGESLDVFGTRHPVQPPDRGDRRPGAVGSACSLSCATPRPAAPCAPSRPARIQRRWSASTCATTARSPSPPAPHWRAVAGILLSSFRGVNPTMGAAYTLNALIVIVMGGIGNVAGGLVAGADPWADPDPGRHAGPVRPRHGDRVRRLRRRAAVASAGPVRHRPGAAGVQQTGFRLPKETAGIVGRAAARGPAAGGRRLLAAAGDQHPHLRGAGHGLGLLLRPHALRVARRLRLLRARRLLRRGAGRGLLLPRGAARRGWPSPWWCSAVVGLATLRLSGMYFVIFTFGLASLVSAAATWWEFNVAKSSGWYVYLSITDRQIYYQLLVLCAAIVALWLWRDRTRMGFAMRTLGADETVARQIGINTVALKIGTFVVSSVVMALAGAILAPRNSYVTAQSVFNPEVSFLTVIAALLGGATSVWGPMLGVVPLLLVKDYLSIAYSSHFSVLLGLILLGRGVLHPQRHRRPAPVRPGRAARGQESAGVLNGRRRAAARPRSPTFWRRWPGGCAPSASMRRRAAAPAVAAVGATASITPRRGRACPSRTPARPSERSCNDRPRASPCWR